MRRRHIRGASIAPRRRVTIPADRRHSNRRLFHDQAERPGAIVGAYQHTLELEAWFHQDGRFLRIWGNHDDAWAEDVLVKHYLQPVYGGPPLRVREHATGHGWSTPATDWRLRARHNVALYSWAARQPGLVLIAGHTHRPVFKSKSHADEVREELEAGGPG